MFAYEALYDLVVTKRTVVRKPPKSDLHFGDAVVVNHNDSDGEGSRTVQSLDESIRISVDSIQSLAGSVLRPDVSQVSGGSNPGDSDGDFDPKMADAVLWERSLTSTSDSEVDTCAKPAGGEQDEAE